MVRVGGREVGGPHNPLRGRDNRENGQVLELLYTNGFTEREPDVTSPAINLIPVRSVLEHQIPVKPTHARFDS